MAVDYTFPTNTNPSSAFWDGNITSVTSNGTAWVFQGGTAASLATTHSYLVNSSNDLEIESTFSMPSTSGGYNGLTLQTSDYKYQIHVDANWEKQSGVYWIQTVVNSTSSWSNTGVSAGTQITAKIIVKKDGSALIYINGTLKVTVAAGSFTNQTFRITLSKYTETTGYVYSGYVKYPIPSEANFMTFFNQYL